MHVCLHISSSIVMMLADDQLCAFVALVLAIGPGVAGFKVWLPWQGQKIVPWQ